MLINAAYRRHLKQIPEESGKPKYTIEALHFLYNNVSRVSKELFTGSLPNAEAGYDL